MIEVLPLSKIRIDGATQVRVHVSLGAVSDYSLAMQAGASLPPLVVFHDGSDYWLADGFHRFFGRRDARMEGAVECEVHQGTVNDARLYAAGANRKHGLRLTNDDKRRAVKMVLEVAPDWSDSRIAEHVGVDHKTVAAIREQLGNSQVEDRRVGKDGKSRPAKRKAVVKKSAEPLLESTNESYHKVRSDPQQWEGVLEERQQWEEIDGDGLPSEPEPDESLLEFIDAVKTAKLLLYHVAAFSPEKATEIEIHLNAVLVAAG